MVTLEGLHASDVVTSLCIIYIIDLGRSDFVDLPLILITEVNKTN